MSVVWQVFSAVPYSNKPVVKDFVASLHSYFTSNILIAFAIVISFKHFGGRPIECMLPVGFNGAWEQYAENYCWAQDTYFVPPKVFVEEVSAESRRESRISYYQWIPFFMLFQSVCFKAPTLIWKYLSCHSGMKVGQILRMATDPANSVPDVKKANIEALSVHLQGALRFHRRLKKKKLVPHKILRFLNVKYSSYYVAAVYMVAKITFLANVIFQICLLSRYLLPEYKNDFGLFTWQKLLFSNGINSTTSSWHTTGIFPRVTLCDFEVREMGNIQNHTVQCVLVVNIFTEKVFILLWTWFAFLTAFTVVNVSYWLCFLFGECSQEHFLLNHLEMSETPFDRHNSENQENVNRFTRKYLGTDGLFVLQMIASHADVVFTTELIAALWKSHYTIEEQRRAMKRWTTVWPQHEKRLEEAIIKEIEYAAELGEAGPDVLEKKRSFVVGSVSPSRRASAAFYNKSMPSAPILSNESLREIAVASAARRGSIASIGQFNKFRRRRSLDDADVDVERVRRYADSSDEDESERDRSGKNSKSNSRRNSKNKH